MKDQQRKAKSLATDPFLPEKFQFLVKKVSNQLNSVKFAFPTAYVVTFRLLSTLVYQALRMNTESRQTIDEGAT